MTAALSEGARPEGAEVEICGTLHQAGLSIWVEDWAEVARRVGELRSAGHDVPAYFAARPQELEQLHRTVEVRDVNDFTLDLLGGGEKGRLLGPLAEIVPASARTFEGWVAAIARGDRFHRAESQLVRRDGSVCDCLVSATLPAPVAQFRRIVVCIVDISAYKADQARLAAAEREAARFFRASAIGALTASIAHEVKSPLAAAVTNAHAALRWLRRPTPDVEEAEAAICALIEDAMRARAVVDRTRSLLTRSKHSPAPLDLADAIAASVQVMGHELKEAKVALRVVVEPDTPMVLADMIQLRQILDNLIQNAVHALAGVAAPREIVVRAAAHAHGACVSVSDNGIGIAPERIGRIFDPFVSDKPDGMGVGLLICKASVETHGGRIWVTSVPAEGTTFHFTLPAAVQG